MNSAALRKHRLKMVRSWKLLPMTVEEVQEAEAQIYQERGPEVFREEDYRREERYGQEVFVKKPRMVVISPAPPLPPKIQASPALIERIQEVRRSLPRLLQPAPTFSEDNKGSSNNAWGKPWGDPW